MIIAVLILIYLFLRLVPPVAWFCQTFFPSNIVLNHFRQRDRLRWGVPVGLAGVAVYYPLFLILSAENQQWGWLDWLRILLGMFSVISLAKFALFVPFSIVLLVGHSVREAILMWRVRRQWRREAKAAGNPTPDYTAEQREQLRASARQALATR
ncbi:hypothetical protein [Microcella frigidaquae]|uniref:Uncharacterized protein n=1 Tax=Microcella frigidaquae TaxID=424758 RepID=A0A840X6A8_9MICO|nr:hypothetical protein [Microcella frigidaquae]MBB5618073.1 hypothetical protein [Microcella frigidaquae]NHN45639.1 hypothetical protein [Microcella frigidaquae]